MAKRQRHRQFGEGQSGWAPPKGGWPRFCSGCGKKLPDDTEGTCDACLGVTDE